MDTRPPRPSNYKYYLCPNQWDEFPYSYFPSFIDVNIFGSDNTNSTWFTSKHSGPDSKTYCSDATIATTKCDNALQNQFSFILSPTSNTITRIPIQTVVPPLSKMGRDTNNNPPFPGANLNVQGRSLLRQNSRLDKNNTNNHTAQRSHQLGHAGVASGIDLINVSKKHKIRVRRDHNVVIIY